jgi:hypothetical protein
VEGREKERIGEKRREKDVEREREKNKDGEKGDWEKRYEDVERKWLGRIEWEERKREREREEITLGKEKVTKQKE